MITLKDLEETFEVYMSEALIRAWSLYPDDKPARREFINNYADSLIRDYRYTMMREELTEDIFSQSTSEDLEDYKFLKEVYENEEEEEDVNEVLQIYMSDFINNKISILACRDILKPSEEAELIRLRTNFLT